MYRYSRRSRTLTREVHPQEGLEEDYRDELLGSQLEKELNLSIEKMREDEEQASPERQNSGAENWSLDLKGASKASPLGSPASLPTSEELLEDIEMPTLVSASFHDSVELVSLSFSNSPPKSIRSLGSSILQNSAAGRKFSDTFEKIEAFSIRSPTKFENLVDIEEVRFKDHGVSSADGGQDGTVTSPQSLSDHRMTLGAGIKLLDISNVNDSLVTQSPLDRQTPSEKVLAASPTQDQTNAKELVQDKPAGVGEDDFLSSTTLLFEAKTVIAALELTGSDFSQGDSSTVPSIDIENITDDLLSGISMLKSPEKKINEEISCNKVEKKEEVVDRKPVETKSDVSFTCEKPSQPEDSSTSCCPTTTNSEKAIYPVLVDRLNDKESHHINATIDKQSKNPSHDLAAQNNTFTMNNVCNKTFEKNYCKKPCLGINTTFDKDDTRNASDYDNAVNTTYVQKPMESEKEQLNVTFEKRGEYKIGSLNETVNLMDAEEQVLQLILDSTPKKPTRASIGHTSTPKTTKGLCQPSLDSTVNLDSNKTFHRRSLSGRVENLSRENCTQIDPTVSRPQPKFALKLGDVGQQAVASQLRRLQGGGSLMRAGPLKALPLKAITTSQAHSGKPGTSDTPLENCEGMKMTSEDGVGAVNSGSAAVGQGHPDPSLGGHGSFEIERPGTPILSSMVVGGMSTPDAFRRGSESSGPRITSTPTTTCEVPFSMDGPIPTPISRCRMLSIASTVSSDASPPIARSNGLRTSEASTKLSEEKGVSSTHTEHPLEAGSCPGVRALCSNPDSIQPDIFVPESTHNKNEEDKIEVPETTHKKYEDLAVPASNQKQNETQEIAVPESYHTKVEQKQEIAAPKSNHTKDGQLEIAVIDPAHKKDDEIAVPVTNQNKNEKQEIEAPESNHTNDEEKYEIPAPELNHIKNQQNQEIPAPESNPTKDEQLEIAVIDSTHNNEKGACIDTAVLHETEVNIAVLKMKPSDSDDIGNSMAVDDQSQNKDGVNLKCNNEYSSPMPLVCEEIECNLARDTTHSQPKNPCELVPNEKQNKVFKSSKKEQPKLSMSKPKSTPLNENNKENKRSHAVASGHIAVKPKTGLSVPNVKRVPSPRPVLKPSDSNTRKSLVKPSPAASKVLTNCNEVNLKSNLKPLKTLQFVNRKNIPTTKSTLPSTKSLSNTPTLKPLSEQNESVPPSLKIPSKFQSSTRLKQPIGTLKLVDTNNTLGKRPVSRGPRSALPRFSTPSSHKPSLLRAPKPVVK
ncbi:hypothetical protein Pcinc_017069 [Petrolisthes cinctipes]|uniref:Uncharacterized protein n=1 Tax=Petrolisthes cinctipes TaxID=88211 RepID=A0AAE1KNW7_PETCI|nr:hypothetical protein Pcinc_017069 [Petrolisthes cinctipes]